MNGGDIYSLEYHEVTVLKIVFSVQRYLMDLAKDSIYRIIEIYFVFSTELNCTLNLKTHILD